MMLGAEGVGDAGGCGQDDVGRGEESPCLLSAAVSAPVEPRSF